MLQPPTPERLDHALYAHRRLAEAQGTRWPGGRPTAAFMLVRVQALELDPPAGARRDPRWRNEFGNFQPDYRSHSLIEYGNRIGVFRLLDLLQPLGWQVAAAVNGLVASEQPALVRSLEARGAHIVASGWSASRMVDSEVPPDTERAWLADTLAALSDATGRMPACFASQDYGYSLHTPSLLAQHGLRTAIDWPNDEMPFLFGEQREIVMLPPAAEMEDTQMVAGRRLQPPAWAAQLRAGLDHWARCGRPGTVLALPLHAWISGAAHRFASLREVLLQVDAAQFWQAAPHTIAQAWRANVQGLPGAINRV